MCEPASALTSSLAPPTPVSAPVPAPVPTLSPEEIHRLLLKVHRHQSELQWRFIAGLLAIDEGKLYLVLGYSSTLQYAEKHFGMERTTTYEAIRVARALEDLPEITRAFVNGLAYSRVIEITRVASTETQALWIDFAKRHSHRQLKLEVKDAIAKGRDKPREKNPYGLPAVRTRFSVVLAPQEYELVQNALKKVQKELEGSLGGEEVEPRVALLFMAKRFLETDPGSAPAERTEKEESIYTILYHRCLDCHRDHLMTEEGAIEVPPAVVDAVEPAATKVTIDPDEEVPPEKREKKEESSPAPEIDKPNTRSFRRRLLLRDGCVCANPRCGRRIHLHGHHVFARGKGGRTAFYNEVVVCVTCHSLIELGYLRVEGDPIQGFDWTTKADGLARDLEEEAVEIARIPVVRASAPSGYPDGWGGDVPGSTASGYPDAPGRGRAPAGGASADEVRCVEDCIAALRKLGASKEEAVRSSRKGFEKLRAEGTPPATEALFKLACRYLN